MPRVAAVLAAYGVPPERLVVEVAEPRVAGDLPTVVARLAGLRSLGVRTALDDFRAEHASLAQLRRLPIDLLKVGPELVGARPDGQPPLIDVVVNLGERLGVEIVAEELESSAQVERARRARLPVRAGFRAGPAGDRRAGRGVLRGVSRQRPAEAVRAQLNRFTARGGAVLPRGVRCGVSSCTRAGRLPGDDGEQLPGGVRAVRRDVPAAARSAAGAPAGTAASRPRPRWTGRRARRAPSPGRRRARRWPSRRCRR